jgi:DNA-binding NarL/FixJ family response regulator
MYGRILNRRKWGRPIETATRMKKKTAKPKDWSDAEKRQLATLVSKGTDAREIALALGRHIASVRKTAREMKLVLKKAPRRPPAKAYIVGCG